MVLSTVRQRVRLGWKSLNLDMKTVYLMLKGSIPVAVSLSIYQSNAGAETFTSLGFLVAIIAVVTVNLLPRAKLIQMTFSICVLTAIAIPLAMLATWSGLQARFHTDPQGLHKYNSSQSAITGVWLFFHIWLSNSIQARYPALLIPTILYNIFMIVQFVSCSRFTTWAECWGLIYLTTRCYYTGVAISFVSGIIIYPVTCRSEIFEVQEKYIHSARDVLSGSLQYLVQVSKTPAFPPLSRQHGHSSEDNIRADGQTHAGNILKQQMSNLKAIYIKMHEELIMAKREVAWGKLSARDITATSDLCRRILMPIGGMSHLPDMLQRIESEGGWKPSDVPSGEKTDCEDHEAVWQSAVAALIEPATILIEAVNDGFEHAGLQLEIIPRPGTSNFMHWMPGAQRSVQTDAEARGEVIEPGNPRFSQLLEKKLNEFSASRVESLKAWVAGEGAPIGLREKLNHLSDSDVDDDFADERIRGDRRQLYLIMYMQQMLYSTGISVLELCKFSDRLVAEGVMSRSRLIVPSGRMLRKWLLSIFDTADAAIADDDRPSSKKEGALLYGKSTRTTRNIEHLPPKSAFERSGVKIRRFQEFLRGPEFSFGFRSACAAMSCAIIAYLHPTQELFTHYRLIWGVIIAAIGANMSAGQSGVSYFLRILGSFAALIICYLVWYIADGHTAGVIVLMWFASFLQMYFLIRWPRYIIGWLVVLITEVLSIGYLTQVNKIGVAAATASGVIYYRPYSVAAARVACVLWGTGASMFFTYLPYPITARGLMRKDMAVVMHLIANYHTVVQSTLKVRLRGTEGDTADKQSQGHILSHTRRAMFNKVVALTSSVKHSVYLQKYEPTLGGKFPVAIYLDILTQLGELLDYMALISYSTQVWSTNGPHTQYFHHSAHTQEWMQDLAKLIGPATASAAGTTAIMYQLSGAISTGHPLPRKSEPAIPYDLSQALRHLDPNVLRIEHIPDLGYSTYAVVELISSMIARKINTLSDSIENLVGVAYFDVGEGDLDDDKMQ